MQKLKSLYWLEYSSLGGPLVITLPFEAVGFEIVGSGFWQPDHPDVFTQGIFSEIETSQPDLIVFLMLGVGDVTMEPAEWIVACQLIRENTQLQHTKIMAILGTGEITAEQEIIWRQRYDFYSKLPFRIIEFTRTAKQLIGEQLKGFEGVNYYLSLGGRFSNGSWSIQDHLINDQASKNELQPDAEGQFAYMPYARLLTISNLGEYIWQINSIKAKTPTYLVYLIKPLSAWQEGLGNLDIERLVYLAQRATPEYQLLIGVNETLLQTGPEIIRQVLERAQQAGGWRIFIIEHMWFEIVPNRDFDKVVYEGEQSFLMI